MLWTPQKGKLLVEHTAGSVGSRTFGTSVTTGAAASTKGTAVELIASTAFDAYWISILAHGYGNSTEASEGCLDILIGAATEEVLIPDLLMGYSNKSSADVYPPKTWDFPLYIPAGSRLAARAAGVRTSTAFYVAVFLYGGIGLPPFRAGGKVTTLGIATVPNGTAITPGASGAEGSWTEVIASTAEDYFALVPSFQLADNTAALDRFLSLDIAVGAAAAEEEIGSAYGFMTSSRESMHGPFPTLPCFQDIPSGTRLSMRASCEGTIDPAYQVALHAVS